VLVIGYGNPLRRDDGAGPAVAERFAKKDGVRVIIAHQLVPELADELVVYERVVFVDAAVTTHRVEVRQLDPAECDLCLGHTGDPEWLLGLTAALHGSCPPGWLVTLPAHDLGHGEGLSVETRTAVDAAVELVERLCGASR
jgi:hydrogenase maturation protease